MRSKDGCLWAGHKDKDKQTKLDLLWEMKPAALAEAWGMLAKVQIFPYQPLPPPQPNPEEPARSRNHKTAKRKYEGHSRLPASYPPALAISSPVFIDFSLFPFQSLLLQSTEALSPRWTVR